MKNSYDIAIYIIIVIAVTILIAFITKPSTTKMDICKANAGNYKYVTYHDWNTHLGEELDDGWIECVYNDCFSGICYKKYIVMRDSEMIK